MAASVRPAARFPIPLTVKKVIYTAAVRTDERSVLYALYIKIQGKPLENERKEEGV